MLTQIRRATRIPQGIDQELFRNVDPYEIVEKVCNFCTIESDDLFTPSRERRIVEARHLICYFVSLNPDISLNNICMFSGHKNHASVVHSRNTIENWMDVYPRFTKDLSLLFWILEPEN